MQRYEKYKDSGIDWLGEIPEHWEVKRFQSLFLLGKGLSITKADLKEEGVHCVNYGEIHSKYGFELKPEKHSLKFVDKSYLKTYPNALLKKGDFVFADTSEDISGSGNFTFLNSDIPVFSGYHTVIARPIHKGESKFFAYQFDSIGIRQQIRFKVKGVKVFSITQSLLKEVQLFIPQLYEQKAISKFLDDKCEKIDAAAKLKEQQIEKLKELRQITIHNAVTKGISHFKGEVVPTKDSGIDWIGEIPEHWAILSLKHLSRKIVDGAHFTPTYVDSGVPFLRVTDLSNSSIDRKIDWTNVKYIPEIEHKELIKRANPERGDILLSKNGTIGLTRVIDWDEEFSFFVSLCLIKPIEKLSANYFEFFFNCPIVDRQINDGSSRTSVTNLHLEKIKELLIILPPLCEQQEIVSYLDKQTSKIDKAIAQKQEQIVKLKEYKQSLINEVVTGKIKVAV